MTARTELVRAVLSLRLQASLRLLSQERVNAAVSFGFGKRDKRFRAQPGEPILSESMQSDRRAAYTEYGAPRSVHERGDGRPAEDGVSGRRDGAAVPSELALCLVAE